MLGIVNIHFNMCKSLQQGLADLMNSPGQISFHLLEGNGEGPVRLRANQINNRFGL
ncbi:hypothetical protein D3C80_1765480 [compost metagenome]